MTSKVEPRVGFLIDNAIAGENGDVERKQLAPIASGLTSRRNKNSLVVDNSEQRDSQDKAQFRVQQEKFKH